MSTSDKKKPMAFGLTISRMKLDSPRFEIELIETNGTGDGETRNHYLYLSLKQLEELHEITRCILGSREDSDISKTLELAG